MKKLLKFLLLASGGAAPVVPDLVMPTTDRLYHFYGGNGVAQPSGITAAGDGTTISAWQDVDLAVNTAQGTGAAQPTYRLSVAGLNNRGAVEFDGGDSLTASATPITFLSDWTIGWVLLSGMTSNGTVWSLRRSSDTNPFLRLRGGSTTKVSMGMRSNTGTSIASPSSTATVFNTVKHIVVARHDNTAKLLYIYIDNLVTPDNGAGFDTSTIAAMTVDRFSLGAMAGSGAAAEHFNGHIAMCTGYSGNHVSDFADAKTHYAIS